MGLIHAVSPSILIPLYMASDNPQSGMYRKPAHQLDYNLRANKLLATQSTPMYLVTPEPPTDYTKQLLYNYVHLASTNRSNVTPTTLVTSKPTSQTQYHVASRVRLLDTPFSASNMQAQHLLQPATITEYHYPIPPATITTISTTTTKTPTTKTNMKDDLEFVPTWYPYAKQQSKFNSFFTIDDAITPYKPLAPPITYKPFLHLNSKLEATSTHTPVEKKTTLHPLKTTTVATFITDFDEEFRNFEKKLQNPKQTTPRTFLSDLFNYVTNTPQTQYITTTMQTKKRTFKKLQPTEIYSKHYYAHDKFHILQQEDGEVKVNKNMETTGSYPKEYQKSQQEDAEQTFHKNIQSIFSEATTESYMNDYKTQQQEMKSKQNVQQVLHEADELYTDENTSSKLNPLQYNPEQNANKKVQPILNEQQPVSLYSNDLVTIKKNLTTNIVPIKPMRLRNTNATTTKLRISPYSYISSKPNKNNQEINIETTTDLYNNTTIDTPLKIKLSKTYAKKRRLKTNNETVEENNSALITTKPRKKYTHKLKRIRPIKQEQTKLLNKESILTTAASLAKNNIILPKRRLRSTLLPSIKLQTNKNKTEKIMKSTTTASRVQIVTTIDTITLDSINPSSSTTSTSTTIATAIQNRNSTGRNRGRSPYVRNLQGNYQKQENEEIPTKRKKSHYSRQYGNGIRNTNTTIAADTFTTSVNKINITTSTTLTPPNIETAIMKITKTTNTERQRKINNLLENLLIPTTAATKLLNHIVTTEYPKLPIEVYFQKVQNNL